ncbi:glutathione S-transferase family protein [Novosphingobium sp.]|jgi:glutathione S-transferase|uniref:glutathione S-transferase family protein n=1 Tax=Novosphingobium sp. TaxID=1874826 RepID=UPI0022C55C68|nr:glutathione S-transferase [Novosphingobium sp.]MCZ8018804.1 glutathione S-transferase [Novosphingobium sp.]MCZ8034809.1 glutathione S-transferase [Novosphingobium sp.]MCZ8052944.1 glutathione S-transferase [Novosphingobium sp.]MCZ8060702.1 glutathione S-transferase [Novosphingobium sp.]MCZ8233245.1 glutathione S-transferase [Novosphingobium sp.]
MSVPQIHLYHCADARSFRALWALEELGLPYELTLMPFPPRARFEGYRDVNPLGTVPACLIDGQLMTESSAIPHVLATRFGPSPLALVPDEPDYPAYMNFLVMGEATLTFPQTIHLRYTRLEPGRCPEAAADYAQWFGARLHNALKLMGPQFACAGRFTMADVSVGYAVMLAMSIGLEEQVPEAGRAYLDRLSQRPAFQRAKEKQQR